MTISNVSNSTNGSDINVNRVQSGNSPKLENITTTIPVNNSATATVPNQASKYQGANIRESNDGPVDQRVRSLFTGRIVQATRNAENNNTSVSSLDRMINYGDESKRGLNQHLTISNVGRGLLTRMHTNNSISSAQENELNLILDRFMNGKFTSEDITKLNDFLKEGVAKGSFNGIVDPTDIQDLSNLLDNINNAERRVQHARGDLYLRGVEDIKNTTIELRDLLRSKPNNAFAGHLDTLLADYEKVLSTGNPASIAVYKKMMQKFLEAAKSGNATGEDLANILREYNQVQRAVRTGDVAKIEAYLGDEFKSVTNALGDFLRNRPSSRSVSNGETSGNENNSSTTDNKGNVLQVNDTQQTTTNKGEKVSTEQEENPWVINAQEQTDENTILISEDTINKVSEVTVEEINEVINEIPGFVEALDEWFEAAESFDNKIEELSNALEEREKLTAEFTQRVSEVFETASEAVSAQIFEQIAEIVKLAEKLEQQLDLGVDFQSASIVPLLEKFREIITTCDKDMKKIIQQMLEKQMLSTNFRSNQLDMMQRWEKLDNAKAEMLKIFNESVEARKTA